MEDLIIKGNKNTPGVFISNGVFLIQGKSNIKNDEIFFQPVIEYAKNYIKAPNMRTTFKVMLEYMDAGSSQAVLQLIKILKRINSNKTRFNVIWCYTHGDIEMVQLGEIIQCRLEMDFEFEEFESIKNKSEK